MVNKKGIEDKVESVSEDEFLFQIEKMLTKINKQKRKYINVVNKIYEHKSFGFAVNYYYNHTQKKYECDFIKKGKIGFEQNKI